MVYIPLLPQTTPTVGVIETEDIFDAAGRLIASACVGLGQYKSALVDFGVVILEKLLTHWESRCKLAGCLVSASSLPSLYLVITIVFPI